MPVKQACLFYVLDFTYDEIPYSSQGAIRKMPDIHKGKKIIVYGWIFSGVRFHTRLKKTSPSVQCVLITTLSAIPEYVHPLNSKQYREK